MRTDLFYMVFNHLRAHQVFKEVNLSEHPEDMAAYGYKVTKNTAICKWVNGGSTSDALDQAQGPRRTSSMRRARRPPTSKPS